MFTSGQVATMLELPSSTLRRYVARYGAALSDGARASRSRRFTDGDVVILRRIRELLSAGKTPAEVDAMLSSVDVAVVMDEAPATVLDLLPGIGQELASQRQIARALQLELAQATDRLEDVSARLAAVETYLALPWYRRPFVRRTKTASE